jgi:hypothetical protein
MKSLTYLSLGAGVQSSALLVMSALGLRGCPRADFAVFADTQDEPQWVYDYLEILEQWGAEHGLPVCRTTKGKLSSAKAGRFLVPIFVEGNDGRAAMTFRKCSTEYKIEPILRFVREYLGVPPGRRVPPSVSVTALLGISIDEADRMKPAKEKWITNRYPLVDAGMTRSGCMTLLEAHGLPIPEKSACVYCPFHSDAAWLKLKTHNPVEFERAVLFDEYARDQRGAGIERPAFLHRSLIPLREVVFPPDDPRFDFDGFNNECEGHCGV